ncbi:hypothetical protein LguiB_028939 [Lonicera macranthoides]
MYGETPNSFPTSSAKVPKGSTTRAERRVDSVNFFRASFREVSDRVTLSWIRVSILESVGRSSKLTGGRKIEEIDLGRV